MMQLSATGISSPEERLKYLYHRWNYCIGLEGPYKAIFLRIINEDIAHQRFLLGLPTHDGFELPWKRTG